MAKYLVIICDGMSDLPLDALGGKTVLEASNTPNMDALAAKGVCGLALTVPEGMSPGSDTANLSIFGYNPKKYYTGRAPLEAINQGIELGEHDAAFRCNIVQLENGIMKDFSGDHIETAYSSLIIGEFNKQYPDSRFEFYPGVSYRNLFVWRDYPYQKITRATPPHDIQGQDVLSHLPTGEGADEILKLMKKSVDLIGSSEQIKNSPLNGKPSSFWIWGGGKKPQMTSYKERFGLNGVTISAVDLIHGIGKAAGLSSVVVEGATGYIDTNYAGKAKAAIDALISGYDIAFVHIESPDESGHEGNLEHKRKSIEDIDSIVVNYLAERMDEHFNDYCILLMPDHATPIDVRTHISDPVPFILYSPKGLKGSESFKKVNVYSEKSCASTGLYVDDASTLISCMLREEI